MNAEQANNLRILIRHMEANVSRTLDMQRFFNGCGTPACAIGEAALCPALAHIAPRLSGNDFASFYAYSDFVQLFVPLSNRGRLFGQDQANAWRRANVTPQEWAAEARKVLAENGYSMEDDFERFMAKVQEPVSLVAA